MVFFNYLGSDLRRQKWWIAIFEIVLVVRNSIVFDWMKIAVRHKHVFKYINQIICTCSINAFSLFEHLLWWLFRNVDIIVLSPNVRLDIIDIAVVMSHFCASFMDQYWIQNIRFFSDRLIAFLNLLFDHFYSPFVLVLFLFNLLGV